MSKVAIPPVLNRGVFGWDSVRLSEVYTADELAEANRQISADPRNANPAHAAGMSIYLHTPQARKRMEALAWAVRHIQTDNRKQEAA